MIVLASKLMKLIEATKYSHQIYKQSLNESGYFVEEIQRREFDRTLEHPFGIVSLPNA